MWTILLQFSAFSAPTNIPIPKLAPFAAASFGIERTSNSLIYCGFGSETPHLEANRRNARGPPHRTNNPMIPMLLLTTGSNRRGLWEPRSSGNWGLLTVAQYLTIRGASNSLTSLGAEFLKVVQRGHTSRVRQHSDDRQRRMPVFVAFAQRWIQVSLADVPPRAAGVAATCGAATPTYPA
jgi:hypothetical protein